MDPLCSSKQQLTIGDDVFPHRVVTCQWIHVDPVVIVLHKLGDAVVGHLLVGGMTPAAVVAEQRTSSLEDV